MKRAKKIVLLAHCLLNVNAKVEGIATVAGGCQKLVTELLAAGYGIIQLPCVEQHCCGIRRWGQVKEQLAFPSFRQRCRELLQPIVEQVQDFAQHGYEIAGVIGLNGSPSCAVNTTCSGNWYGEIGDGYGLPEKIATLRPLQEPGVMMEELAVMLEQAGLKVKFLAVNEADPDSEAQHILSQL